ncbi:MAG: hypothetical protein HY738_13900 [Bacteroidia bacterium]|nr:hypothetical protein [Bacteroidia bacterium]
MKLIVHIVQHLFYISYFYFSLFILSDCSTPENPSDKTFRYFAGSNKIIIEKDTSKFNARALKYTKINKDSLKVYTPGKNGVSLPKIVKANPKTVPFNGIKKIVITNPPVVK